MLSLKSLILLVSVSQISALPIDGGTLPSSRNPRSTLLLGKRGWPPNAVVTGADYAKAIAELNPTPLACATVSPNGCSDNLPSSPPDASDPYQDQNGAVPAGVHASLPSPNTSPPAFVPPPVAHAAPGPSDSGYSLLNSTYSYSYAPSSTSQPAYHTKSKAPKPKPTHTKTYSTHRSGPHPTKSSSYYKPSKHYSSTTSQPYSPPTSEPAYTTAPYSDGYSQPYGYPPEVNAAPTYSEEPSYSATPSYSSVTETGYPESTPSYDYPAGSPPSVDTGDCVMNCINITYPAPTSGYPSYNAPATPEPTDSDTYGQPVSHLGGSPYDDGSDSGQPATEPPMANDGMPYSPAGEPYESSYAPESSSTPAYPAPDAPYGDEPSYAPSNSPAPDAPNGDDSSYEPSGSPASEYPQSNEPSYASPSPSTPVSPPPEASYEPSYAPPGSPPSHGYPQPPAPASPSMPASSIPDGSSEPYYAPDSQSSPATTGPNGNSYSDAPASGSGGSTPETYGPGSSTGSNGAQPPCNMTPSTSGPTYIESDPGRTIVVSAGGTSQPCPCSHNEQ